MDKPEFRVERGPAATDEAFAIGMAKLLEREGRTIAAAELRRLHEAHDWQYKMAGERLRRVEKLEAQRDALLEALKGMLHRDERNTCRHEETHRGGALWEICDSCGAMWADDEGGKPEWEDPKEWTQARAAIKVAEGENHGQA